MVPPELPLSPEAAITGLPDGSEVRTALRTILEGGSADSLEGQHLDFKEDPARSRRPAPNPDAKRIEILLEAAVCFANADGESHLVLGVSDKVSGPAAFTGTAADPDTVRRRIFDRSEPGLAVEIHEVHVGSIRLLDIRVPQGLTVYSRKDGAASRRNGTACTPLTDQDRQQIFFSRANPDFTARPSALSVGDLDPDALSVAHRFIAQRSDGLAPTSDDDMLRRLGVLDDGGRLLVAGEILLGKSRPSAVFARHLWRRVPGGEPSATEYQAPVLIAMTSLRNRIEDRSDPEATRVELPTGQEAPLPDFPKAAIDESVSNAFIHRDWSSTLPIVVDQSPIALNVTSPGGLPRGVDEAHLLSTPSRPRNVALMRALHALGLAEETSRGFDRMWVSMLLAGQTPPTITTDDFQVSVAFTARSADATFVRWIAALIDDGFVELSVRSLTALLSLKHLAASPSLSQQIASRLLQIGQEEAAGQLEWLSSEGLLAPAHAPGEWQLSDRSRDCLALAGGAAPLAGAVEQWILDAVESGKSVTNREVAAATAASNKEVTRILRYLADTRRIEKDSGSPSRGPSVRWRRRTA